MSRERFLLWECEKVKRKEKGIEKRALEGRCGSVRTWDLEKSGSVFVSGGKQAGGCVFTCGPGWK